MVPSKVNVGLSVLRGTQKVFALMSARELIRSRFPVTWRNCCRRVVEDYIRLQKEIYGESIGSTKLVKAMLDPHRLQGNERANERLEIMLTRQDIEAWLRRGVEFSDMKFNFVDYYVQNLLKSELGNKLRANLEEYRVKGISEGLGAIYMIQKVSSFRRDLSEEILGQTFQSLHEGQNDGHVQLIRFDSSYQGVIFARIFTVKGEILSVSETLRSCRVFSGFFIPNQVVAYNESGIQGMVGVLAIQDPLAYNLISHKTAFDSLGLVGFYYGEKGGEIITRPSRVVDDMVGTVRGEDSELERIRMVPIINPIIDGVFERLRGAVL